MNHSVKRTLCGALILILLFSILPTGFAAEKESRTVRVGILDYQGFINPDENGGYVGYGVDLLSEISQYTGWNYEFIPGNFSDHMRNLQYGRIDLICHAQYTPERGENYLFSKYSSGSETSVLYCKLDDDRYYLDDFESFGKMRVAMLEGSFQNAAFQQYAESHDFQYTPVLYSTQEGCFAALDMDAVDAVAMGSLGGISGYKVISLFGSDPFYFITGKMNPDLMEQLDNAMGQIYAKDPTFLTELFRTYYSTRDAYTGLVLTRQEASYIASSGPITVGLLANRPPLSYLNDDGEPDGMTVDLMEEIARATGLTFTYKFLGYTQTGMDFLSAGEGSVVAGVMSSAFSSPNPKLLRSDPIQNGSITFVGSNGLKFSPNSELTVALPSGFIGGQEQVSKLYPHFSYYHGTDNQDCLRAIRDGEADVMLQNMYVVRETLQSPLYDGIEIFPAYTFDEDMLVVALEEQSMLISIINKGIATLTKETKDNIVLENTIGKAYHATTAELVYKYRAPLIVLLVLMLTLLGLLVVIIVIRQRAFVSASKANVKLEKMNEQLGEAVQQATRANSAKSQFLSRMSHEIRTPMNAIVGLTTIARAHIREPEKVEEYLGKIDSSSKVLLGIINDVLDMSAIESDKMKIARSVFDLKQVLNGISNIYYTQCKNKGIGFEMGVDISSEMVEGDSLRVNQILMNLVSNAYKFTPEGGKITIDVRETARKDKNVYIRFTVSDTGCGMSEDMLERLFKPFEQESAQTAQKTGGSGLGLSIAKNLTDLMQGSIHADSRKGEGTTFTVELPFGITGRTAWINPEQLHNMSALIVDDDQNARDYTSVVLKRLGISYQVASDAEEALTLLSEAKQQNKNFDYCFVDWKMPGMNGVELTRKIRSEYSKDTVVIIVSAYDLSEVQDEAKTAGADLFITKPLFQSTVFNALMQLTGGIVSVDREDEAAYDFTGHKLLLAEDNEMNTEVATDILNLVNMEVDHAENGKQAVEMFTSAAPGTYDLILMDVQMPEMNGYQATKAIRASDHPEAKSIAIFAMTANAFTEDVSEALSSGMNGHLSKPIDTKALYKTIADELKKKE